MARGGATSGAKPEKTEALAQPSLWDRLKNDLPGLSLEVRDLRASLQKDLGPDKLARHVSGAASTMEDASLSSDQRARLRALNDAERKARHLSQNGIVVTPGQVVDAVRRDIEALLNTTRFECRPLAYLTDEEDEPDEPPLPLANFENIRSSVVNYGIVPLMGTHRKSLDAGRLAKDVRDALIAFEPRLAPDKLRVEVRRAARSGEAGHVALEVVINGLVTLTPKPEHLNLVAEIDFDTAKASARLDEEA